MLALFDFKHFHVNTEMLLLLVFSCLTPQRDVIIDVRICMQREQRLTHMHDVLTLAMAVQI